MRKFPFYINSLVVDLIKKRYHLLNKANLCSIQTRYFSLHTCDILGIQLPVLVGISARCRGLQTRYHSLYTADINSIVMQSLLASPRRQL